MINLSLITEVLLKELKIRYTKKFLEDSILSHPEHTSLLAITDTLKKYRIDHIALKIDATKLESVPLPCLIQHTSQTFQVLRTYSSENISCTDEKGKEIQYTREEFLDIWTGVCLIVQTNEDSSEPGIELELKNNRSRVALASFAASLLMIWVIWSIIDSPLFGVSPFYMTSFTLLKFIGIITGFLLLWYEVDKYNPTLQSFCSGGKKVNCESVLGSKYAKLFDGGPSISLLTFSYFFGSIGYLTISGFSTSSFGILGLLSFVTLPVIPLSIYYQAVVIKQWCKFCIVVKAVLILEIISVFLAESYKYELEPKTIPLLLGMFLLPLIFWPPIKYLLDKNKEGILYKRSLKTFKWNPNIFNGLLSTNQRITQSTEGLGIAFNNANAKHQIIKVCNPYCGSCRDAHPIIEALVGEGKINLQIIFLVEDDGNNPSAKLVKYFLAINEQGSSKIKEAIEEWYGSERKDLEAFTQKYPMNGEVELQEHKIEAMNKWCMDQKVNRTPTIFIDGHLLPKEYSIEDLKEIL